MTADCVDAKVDDLAQRAHEAAERHLNACWGALQAEEEGDEDVSWPEVAAPFCGCDTCVIRETLTAAWPLLLEAAREEAGRVD